MWGTFVHVPLIYTQLIQVFHCVITYVWSSSKWSATFLHFVAAERGNWHWTSRRWCKFSVQRGLEQEVWDVHGGRVGIQGQGVCTGENPHLPPSTRIVLRNIVAPPDSCRGLLTLLAVNSVLVALTDPLQCTHPIPCMKVVTCLIHQEIDELKVNHCSYVGDGDGMSARGWYNVHCHCT